jgi:hypothetical protein
LDRRRRRKKNPISIDKIKAKAALDPIAIPAISPLLRSALFAIVKSEKVEDGGITEVKRDEAGKVGDVVNVVPDDLLLVDVRAKVELPI